MVDANDLAFIHFKVIIIKKYNFNGVYNFGIQIIFSLTLLVTIRELMMKYFLELAQLAPSYQQCSNFFFFFLHFFFLLFFFLLSWYYYYFSSSLLLLPLLLLLSLFSSSGPTTNDEHTQTFCVAFFWRTVLVLQRIVRTGAHLGILICARELPILGRSNGIYSKVHQRWNDIGPRISSEHSSSTYDVGCVFISK